MIAFPLLLPFLPLLPLLLALLLRSTTHALQVPLSAASPPPLCESCHSCASRDPCTTNSPGGLLLLTQFWDFHPAVGPSDSWTIHGLWPDLCSGGYNATCDPTRAEPSIARVLRDADATDVLDYMTQYWLSVDGNDDSFWAHEWNKHGTCVSTLVPACYPHYTPYRDVVDFFTTTTQLFRRYPTYRALAAAGILPSSTRTYTLHQLQSAMVDAFGHRASFRCRGSNLSEVWFYFHTVGRSVDADGFRLVEPVGSGAECPQTGVRYLPK